MKKYFRDFIVGLIVGLAFFFLGGLLLNLNTAFLNPVYHVVFAVVLYTIYVLISKKKISLLSFVVFLIAFVLPSITWLIIIGQALKNWTLF
jgi:hypothetical protein